MDGFAEWTFEGSFEKLRKEPQYIDAVFTAKANRTKMEERTRSFVPGCN